MLGTFVEITAEAPDRLGTGAGSPSLRRDGGASSLEAAVSAAFAAIEQVQARMSVHDAGSELSRVNSEAFRSPVQVSEETFEVLRRGLALARESEGAFDFTVAPLLARWGLLPGHLRRRPGGTWREVRLLAGRRVRFVKPLAIDLGGIAKGFAVDAAVAALREAGVRQGLVNAGGDLRALGPAPVLVHIRHPGQPRAMAHAVRLRDGAMATSSPCFSERRWRRGAASALVDPRARRAVTGAISVSVQARECWLADALTKVALNAPDLAARLLGRHDAEAFILVA